METEGITANQINHIFSGVYFLLIVDIHIRACVALTLAFSGLRVVSDYNQTDASKPQCVGRAVSDTSVYLPTSSIII